MDNRAVANIAIADVQERKPIRDVLFDRRRITKFETVHHLERVEVEREAWGGLEQGSPRLAFEPPLTASRVRNRPRLLAFPSIRFPNRADARVYPKAGKIGDGGEPWMVDLDDRVGRRFTNYVEDEIRVDAFEGGCRSFGKVGKRNEVPLTAGRHFDARCGA